MSPTYAIVDGECIAAVHRRLSRPGLATRIRTRAALRIGNPLAA
jgi:hypothetical protein